MTLIYVFFPVLINNKAYTEIYWKVTSEKIQLFGNQNRIGKLSFTSFKIFLSLLNPISYK